MILQGDIKTPAKEKTSLTILKTLVYFDIFDYPLSENEIRNFLQQPVTDPAFASAIDLLISEKIIFKVDEFYSLENNRQSTEKRSQGNLCAKKLLPKAYKRRPENRRQAGCFRHTIDRPCRRRCRCR